MRCMKAFVMHHPTGAPGQAGRRVVRPCGGGSAVLRALLQLPQRLPAEHLGLVANMLSAPARTCHGRLRLNDECHLGCSAGHRSHPDVANRFLLDCGEDLEYVVIRGFKPL